MKVQELKNFIGNEFRAPESGLYFDDINPADGSVIARVPQSGTEDVEVAVEFAKNRLNHPVSLKERGELCEEVAQEIEKNLEKLAHLESLDTGKPIQIAREVDIPRAVANFRFFSQSAQQLGSESFETPWGNSHALNYTQRSPLGVVALITPWNLPLYLLSWKVAPALMMGNSVITKPSELTPLTANALAEIFLRLKPPTGVFQQLHGYGNEVGQALVDHKSVHGVSFTGGTESGRKVAAACASQFKKSSLELGGKNASIVFEDCDFDSTVRGVVRAGFLNQGQICLCGSRILIQESIYQKFVKSFLQELKGWKLGRPAEESTRLGALVSSAHLEKVQSYVELAKAEGGQVLCGGERSRDPELQDGFYFEPTVIEGLSSESRTACEEIFGPVVTLHPFKTEDQAIQMANGVRYGLSASVWSRDLNRAHRVSEALETGMVWVNTWLLRDLRVPFGGVKESGLGREGGRYSLEFFSQPKNICVYLGEA